MTIEHRSYENWDRVGRTGTFLAHGYDGSRAELPKVETFCLLTSDMHFYSRRSRCLKLLMWNPTWFSSHRHLTIEYWPFGEEEWIHSTLIQIHLCLWVPVVVVIVRAVVPVTGIKLKSNWQKNMLGFWKKKKNFIWNSGSICAHLPLPQLNINP